MLIVALGSRGDVQPMAVLAAALTRAGIPARVAALAEYADLVASYGAEPVRLPGRLADALRRDAGSRLLLRTVAGQAWALHRWALAMAEPVAAVLAEAVRPGETVVAGTMGRLAGAALAEGVGGRFASVVLTGQVPTRQRDSYYFQQYLTGFGPCDRRGLAINWSLSNRVGVSLGRAVRRRLGLRSLRGGAMVAEADRHPVLVAASPILVPPASDWPAGTHQTGWLAPPATTGYEPPDALVSFLDGGPAPVYVGYGSFTGGGTPDDVLLILAAAERAGLRVVTPVVPGVDPGQAADHGFIVESVPHDWLLPRTAAVVHHGGAGTTQSALAAGVPQVALPFGVDQPYHAWRLHRLGVGPEPLRIQRLTVAQLADRVKAMTTGPEAAQYRVRATSLSASLRSEHGVARTIETVGTLGLT